MRLALVLALLLAGCTQLAAPLLPAWRDTTVSLAAQPVPLDRLAGRWNEVARFPVPFQRGCAGAVVDYAPRDGGLDLRNTCLDAEGRTTRAVSGRAAPTAPGRLSVRLRGVPGAAPLVVLWLDPTGRTLVLGQPDGRAGWILDRVAGSAPDRLAAAEAALRRNGYRTEALVRSPLGRPAP